MQWVYATLEINEQNDAIYQWKAYPQIKHKMFFGCIKIILKIYEFGFQHAMNIYYVIFERNFFNYKRRARLWYNILQFVQWAFYGTL